MLILLTPKQDFQKDDEATKAFRGLVDNQIFKDGIHLAIAEFVLYAKPTAEELEGVNRFLKVLLNMAEKEEPQERTPFMQSISQLKPQPKK